MNKREKVVVFLTLLVGIILIDIAYVLVLNNVPTRETQTTTNITSNSVANGTTSILYVTVSPTAIRGQTVTVRALVKLKGGNLTDPKSLVADVLAPNGTLIHLDRPTRIHVGFYAWGVKTSGYLPGDYTLSVSARTLDTSAQCSVSFAIENQAPLGNVNNSTCSSQ